MKERRNCIIMVRTVGKNRKYNYLNMKHMKPLFVTVLFMLLSGPIFAQYRDLNKLPQKERDSLLVKIANEAIDRYSTGYLRPGDKPYIEDIGYKLSDYYKALNEQEYVGRYMYSVYYLATEKEKEVYFGRKKRVEALILADVGMVTEIIYIDDNGWRRYALEKADPAEIISKRRFKPAEEYQKEIERSGRPTMVIVDSSVAKRKMEEHMRKKRELVARLQHRYRLKQDSIRRQDSIRAAEKKNMPDIF